MTFLTKPESVFLICFLATIFLVGCNGGGGTSFGLCGIRLLDETTRVLESLGPPAEVVPMDYWTSWRYPDLGVTVDFAPILGESPGPDKVIWAKCSKGGLDGGLKVEAPSDVFTRRFPG